MIISEYNNECLDVNAESNGIVDDSDNIITWPCPGGDNQKWKLDGTLIKSKANGGNWCVDGGDTDNNVHIWDCSVTNGNQIYEYPGFSSLTGSASSALSVGIMQMPEMDEDESMMSMISGGWLLPAVGLLIISNIICLIMYCYKKYNGSNKVYKYGVVDYDSETDLENPEQIAIK